MDRLYDYGPRAIGIMGTLAIPGTMRGFDNYMEYLDSHRGVWNILRALEQRNPDQTYQVRLSFPAIDTAPNMLFHSHRNLRDWVESPERWGADSEQMQRVLFNPLSTDELALEVVRVPGPQDPGAPNFRASDPHRIWGYLGSKVSNCVVKQIAERAAYYLVDGTKRHYMWTSDGQPRSLERGGPGFSQQSMNKLRFDSSYTGIKRGTESYMRSRGHVCGQEFGFEPRDLCDLADLCNCRIVVFVTSTQYRVCRWDTDDLVIPPATQERGGRYTFCFDMTSDQHLEILDPETLRDDNGPTYASPGRLYNIEYWTDNDFEKALYYENSKPEQERRLYLIRKRVSGTRYVAPVECPPSPFIGYILQSGDTFYKHTYLREWTESLIQDDGVATNIAACATTLYDIHHKQLLDVYRNFNIRPVYQRRTPSLFLATTRSDMQFGHSQLPMDEGSTMYEYDGRRWYLTDFSSIPGFEYFHGVPMSDTWNEYKAPGTTVRYDNTTGFFPVSVMIGNADGDEAFTFTRDKYAVFQIESLDFGGCSDNTMRHLRRDGLFLDFDSSKSVIFLSSPVVQMLQTYGVVWRASRLWVCYGCADHWVPCSGEGPEVCAEMERNKTYPMVMGKLMCGRATCVEQVYVAPDITTAESLRYWYGRQFAHGRLASDRDDPDVIYEGEEHAPESADHTRPDTNPSDMIFTCEGEFCGTKEKTGCTMSCGSSCETRPDSNTYFVHTYQDSYEWGRTFCHISGAQHAYCFVRLYDTILRLPAEEVVGFSLDAFRTRTDVTELLSDRVSDEFAHGTFKPAKEKPYTASFTRNGPMLSDLYTPRYYMRGICKEDKEAPDWNSYKDSLARISVVTGPAGSGKTTRHFQKHGRDDFRLPRSALYITMTNHLAHHTRTHMGVRALTSFKGFNRKVDEKSVSSAVNRYVKKHQNDKVFNELAGSHTVLLDEVSMIPVDKIKDAIDVCRAHWCQMLITGDFDRDQFYQLGPVTKGSQSLFEVLRGEEADGRTLKWIPPMQVFRQSSDRPFAEFLQSLRGADGAEAWDLLDSSDLFRHIDYEDMLREMDPEKDLVAHPWHRVIGTVTRDKIASMTGDSRLKIRGNFPEPRRVGRNDPELIARLKAAEEDTKVFKGSVCVATKDEMMTLRNTQYMSEGLYSPSQLVNPMISATIFNLQGLSMPEDGTLYILRHTPNATEWVDPGQPKVVYVAASRARSAKRLVIVDCARVSKRPRVA